MQRSSNDLRLGTLLSTTTSRASTSHGPSHGPSRGPSRSPTPKGFGPVSSSSYSRDKSSLPTADMNWDQESKSLGLFTQNSDEDPLLMQNIAAEYAIDIGPSSRAREFLASTGRQDHGDDHTVTSNASSTAFSALTMDSLNVQNQFAGSSHGRNLPGGARTDPNNSNNNNNSNSNTIRQQPSRKEQQSNAMKASQSSKLRDDVSRPSSIDGSDVTSRSDVDGHSNAQTSVRFLAMDAFDLFP